MRQLPRTRREVTDEILVKVIQPLNIERKGILLNFLGCKDSEKSDVKSVVVEGKFVNSGQAIDCDISDFQKEKLCELS